MDESKSTKPQQPGGDGGGRESDSGDLGEPYQYTPLPEAEPTEPGQDPVLEPRTLWTRLLTIHPGEYDDDIAVDLSDVALEETAESQLRDKRMHDPEYCVSEAPHLEQYEALSYVWGSQENPSRVIVGEERRIIPITRNLDVAMRHLRYPDRPRVMWIDAICIDQTNPTDKNRQVGYMRYIYWSTRRVVVWLGPEADDSNHAMNVIASIGEKIRINWQNSQIRCVTEEDENFWGGRYRLRDLPLDGKDWTAIDSFVKRPWFERIWIRQEVRRAGDEAAIYCGSSRISFNVFRRGLFRVTDTHPLDRAALASNVVRPFFTGLADLKFVIKGARCTDPRDYIYGTLGLIEEGRHLTIRPDYSKTLTEIFQKVVLSYLDIYCDLEILRSCGNYLTADQLSMSPGNIKLPSWVPDFTSGIGWHFHRSVYRRFVRIAGRTEYFGNGILRVAGLLKGVIQDMIELDATTQLGLSASLRRVVPRNSADVQYPGGGSLWDAYCIALCGNCFKERTAPARTMFFLSEADSHVALRAIVYRDDPLQSQESTPMWTYHSPEYRFKLAVEVCLLSHQFFITEEGLLGWAPTQARQGDCIAIMLGSETPTVLRPISFPETDRYEVIGPCYLQGFMFGEGFLGALPERVRPVEYFDDEVGSISIKFVDKLSGESSVQDPRSDTFSDPDKSWAWRKGQTQRLVVEVEELRSAGLDIRYFDLV